MMDLMKIIEISLFLGMMLIVGIFWCRNNNDLISNILLAVWLCFVYWLNAPNFLNIIEGTQPKNSILGWPLQLYQSMGTWYLIISNALLATAGVLVSKEWDKRKQYNPKMIKQKFDIFAGDATELQVIGRDLDFLLDDDYQMQRHAIEKLKDKAKLLCAASNEDRLIGLYDELLQKGIQVRTYSSREGIANLKGQIKTDEHKRKSGIFVRKSPPEERPKRLFTGKWNDQFFELTELSDGYLVDSISEQFERSFADATNPVIHCIALDLGGVYLDGDLDDFYGYIKQEFNIKVPTGRNDRLNINDEMMRGDITIRQYLMKVSPATRELDDGQWEKILEKWQNTWTPNDEMKKLVEDIAEYGYEIIPFSNLDRENGDKYIRESYFPSCCTETFLSYDRKMNKPEKRTFQAFSELAKSHAGIFRDCQILLIDDQMQNISAAKESGWKTICYSNKNRIDVLTGELKKINVLPDGYTLY